MTAVHQDGQLDGPGAADGAQGVEGGADGAPGVEDVVHQDHDATVDASLGDVRGARDADGVASQVVAVHGDVKGSLRDCVDGVRHRTGGVGLLGRGGGEGVHEAVGQGYSPAGDTQHHEVPRPVVALEDLVGDSDQGPLDLGSAEDLLARGRWRLIGSGGGARVRA